MQLVDLAGVFRGTEALAAGMVTKEQLRGPGVRRLFRDVYLPAGMRLTHQQRCAGAALLAPPEAVLTGRSAATVLGVELARPTDPVEFVVDERYRFGPIRGIVVKRTVLTGADWQERDGIRIAGPARLGLDLAVRANLRGAVADLDEVLRAGCVDRAELASRLVDCHEHGVARARQAVDLADPRAQSRPESELRVVLHLADLHPEPQVQVWDAAGPVCWLDLAFRESRVGIAYDGQWHALRLQLRKDRRMINRLQALDWEIIFVTAEDLYQTPHHIIRTVRTALTKAHSAGSAGLFVPHLAR
ncbi:MAG: type IV toxin-antitoxin system AbiEi family antitoxin [Pseudonocardiaceae bacterium]